MQPQNKQAKYLAIKLIKDKTFIKFSELYLKLIVKYESVLSQFVT